MRERRTKIKIEKKEKKKGEKKNEKGKKKTERKKEKKSCLKFINRVHGEHTQRTEPRGCVSRWAAPRVWGAGGPTRGSHSGAFLRDLGSPWGERTGGECCCQAVPVRRG